VNNIDHVYKCRILNLGFIYLFIYFVCQNHCQVIVPPNLLLFFFEVFGGSLANFSSIFEV
jgi:hypothetical protein